MAIDCIRYTWLEIQMILIARMGQFTDVEPDLKSYMFIASRKWYISTLLWGVWKGSKSNYVVPELWIVARSWSSTKFAQQLLIVQKQTKNINILHTVTIRCQHELRMLRSEISLCRTCNLYYRHLPVFYPRLSLMSSVIFLSVNHFIWLSATPSPVGNKHAAGLIRCRMIFKCSKT